MSGLLSVIEGNPRRKSRRKSHKRAKARRPKRRRRVARASNPSHHRRVRRVHRRRRHSNPRRRRHRNPLGIGGGAIVAQLMKAGSFGLGLVAANALTSAVNHFGFQDKMAGTAKIGLKVGVGVGGYMLLKAMKQESLGKFLLLGAGIAAAQDVYEQFIKPTVVAQAPWLADYDYGSLQGYRTGSLQGWAPQAGLGGWAPQSGLSGDGNAYDAGAYE